MTCDKSCSFCGLTSNMSQGVVNLSGNRSEREEASGVSMCDGECIETRATDEELDEMGKEKAGRQAVYEAHNCADCRKDMLKHMEVTE